MSDHVYKSIEITGSSEESVDDAIRKGVERASETVRNLRWFEVTDIRGHIADQELNHFQVTMKIGFTLDPPSGDA